MKPLTGQRRISIAKGEADMSPDKVLSFRFRWAAQGYDLPPLSLPIDPASD
jgi:hypothetical protein